MNWVKTLRKKRNDRNYILYRVSGEGESYIGVTVANGRAYLKSVKVRVQKHFSRAKKEDKDWLFCQFLRKVDSVEYEVLEIVRGRKPAYQRERVLIEELGATLNTF